MESKTPLLVVLGPTASGKTKLSVDLALNFGGEIISADSMQIYRGMDIGTAKVKENEKMGVKHHLIDIVLPSETFSAASYKEMAEETIKDIYSRNKLPIMAGGTGLYINSVIENVRFGDYKPDYSLREKLIKTAEEKGGEYLLGELEKFDPVMAKKLHFNDIKRIVRSHEIYLLTGIPQSKWIEESKKVSSPYITVLIGLNYKDRATLYERINRRVEQMISEGLVDEVKSLYEKYNQKGLTSLQAIGYKEIIEYFENRRTLDEATDKIKQETRRYAKRQLTWFNKNKDINWIYIDEEKSYEDILKKALTLTDKLNFKGK